MKEKITPAVFCIILIISPGCLDFLAPDPEIQAAVKAGDPELCKKIPADEKDRRDRCYADVGARIRDPEVCKRILDAGRKNYCFMEIAEAVQDASICKSIEGEYTQRDCIRRVAVAKGDVELCEGIEDESSYVSCVIEVARKTKTPAHCSRIKEEGPSKQYCLSEAAAASGQPELCAEVEYLVNRNSCYSTIAINSKNSSLCDQITVTKELESSSQLRDNCYNSIGRELRDADTCRKVSSPSTKAWCLQEVAAATADESLCEDIVDADEYTVKEKCYERVAIGKQDKSLCEKIVKDASLKRSCLEYIETATTTTTKAKDGWAGYEFFNNFMQQIA